MVFSTALKTKHKHKFLRFKTQSRKYSEVDSIQRAAAKLWATMPCTVLKSPGGTLICVLAIVAEKKTTNFVRQIRASSEALRQLSRLLSCC